MSLILSTLLEEFWDAVGRTEQHVHRDCQFPEADNLIKVAVGMRRSGKTGLLFQKVRELRAQGIQKTQILYLNFEDERILPMNHKQMGELIDAWFSMFPENHALPCYLFFDEVQNIEQWALVLRRLMDTKQVQIYVTGSSAKMLSKEIATSLRGRSVALEVFPYSFHEYLEAHSQVKPAEPLGRMSYDVSKQQLTHYLTQGGFPGIQMFSHELRVEVLQSYVQTVILRDIVERYQVSNIPLLRYLTQNLLKNFASSFSVNKFFNDIKSQGYSIGRDTLYLYLSYIEDAYLVFLVPVFSESLRYSQTAPKKVYAIDSGLVRANTISFSDNLGRCFENLIYLDFKRQGKEVFYYKTSKGYEIDFVTKDLLGHHEIIQVAWDTTDIKTREREIRALEMAQAELGFPGRLIEPSSYLR